MTASVLVVDDEELIRWSLERELRARGYAVAMAGSRAEALARFTSEPADVVLLDVKLPDGSGLDLIPSLRALRDDVSIVMITSMTGLDTAVEAMRRGASDYVTKPFDFPKLWNSVAQAAERVRLVAENRALRARNQPAEPEIVAASPAMQRALALAARLASTDSATALLLGESGSGKDVLARWIHRHGPRADSLFLDLNCAGIPEALLESELFGHEKGAFTDARSQKRGLFELATGGSVFLDEIGDAPALVQTKLLKVLEQRSFRRLGGVRDLTTDVRMIAATNRDLAASVAAHTFREDLYYRLKVFPIEVPPLRERREDVLPLARIFLRSYARAGAVPEIEAEAGRLLEAYRWPGNVRELRNVIERAVILAAGGSIGADVLPAELVDGASSAGSGPPDALAAQELRLVRDAMHRAGGNQSRAAVLLGISRDALRRRLNKFGLVAKQG